MRQIERNQEMGKFIPVHGLRRGDRIQDNTDQRDVKVTDVSPTTTRVGGGTARTTTVSGEQPDGKGGTKPYSRVHANGESVYKKN